MKSILFINSGSLPIPATSGGAVQQVLGHIASGLANQGWTVGVMTVMTDASRKQQAAFADNPMLWHEIETPIHSGGIRGILKAIRTVKCHLRAIQPEQYSHVVIYDPYLAPVVKSWNPGAAIVWSAHNVRKKTKFAMSYWFKSIDRVISISEFLKSSIESEAVKRKNRPHTVIHNPLGQEWFDVKRILNKQPFSLLFCGRIVPDKGLHVLIDAIDQLPEHWRSKVKLSIAGGSHFLGSAENEYTRMIRSRLEQCQFSYELLGYIPHAELMRVYDQHEIFVIPSVWDEPATLVASEGQARGCKIIASIAGGLPEMVAPRWKPYLAAKGDSSQLSLSIERMLEENHGDPSTWGDIDQWLKSEFTLEGIVQKWEYVLLL